MPSVAVIAPAAVPRHCVEALEQRLAAVADAADEQLSSVHLTLRLEQSCFVRRGRDRVLRRSRCFLAGFRLSLGPGLRFSGGNATATAQGSPQLMVAAKRGEQEAIGARVQSFTR